MKIDYNLNIRNLYYFEIKAVMIDFPRNDRLHPRPPSDTEHHLHVTRYPESVRTTVFERFKALAARLFLPEEKIQTDQRLTGRIQTLQNDVLNVLKELNAIKENLEKEADKDLIKLVEEVVNPIIREVQGLKRIEKPTSLAEQLDAVQRYNQWINRAKPWADFFAYNLKNRSAVIQAIVSHAIQNSAEMIDKDLRHLEEYKKQRLLKAPEEERAKLEEKIELKLSNLRQNLMDLRTNALFRLSLSDLKSWKHKFVKDRGDYYQKSLDAIDEEVSDEGTLHPHDDHEVVQTIHVPNDQHASLSRISSLDEMVTLLLDEASSGNLSEERREKLLLMLDALEYDINLLHQELRLSHEAGDRLQLVQEKLDHAKKHLK